MSMASTAYLNRSGKPLLRTSVCGFLDVLGFSNLSTTASSRDDAQRLLERISAAIADSRAFVRGAFGSDPRADPSRWALKFFSDNLVFGFPADEKAGESASAISLALRCVQGYQLRMALNGFFVRGAIGLGEICLTDEIIFGPALVQCYCLESKMSIVPRVIVDESLRAAIDGENVTSGMRDWICRDVDGWWFVNYLDAVRHDNEIDWKAIERHKAAVLSSLAETTSHDVLAKYGWTRRYQHNVFCHWHQSDAAFSPECIIDRADEQSTIQRLSDLRSQSS